ncbi:MAG: hypothetical protein HC781_12685 [Leptolyngbyaceae cyanobacterium CSU_1_4]|nr:hypothetical protein [Leptolyngbyaceae cyanobacterium CSU_1_4]
MRIPLPNQLNASDSSDSPLLNNVVIFPDGSVTWVTPSPMPSEVISTVTCEVVPEGFLLPAECLRLPQPQPPDIFVSAPEFTPLRTLKSMERF